MTFSGLAKFPTGPRLAERPIGAAVQFGRVSRSRLPDHMDQNNAHADRERHCRGVRRSRSRRLRTEARGRREAREPSPTITLPAQKPAPTAGEKFINPLAGQVRGGVPLSVVVDTFRAAVRAVAS